MTGHDDSSSKDCCFDNLLCLIVDGQLIKVRGGLVNGTMLSKLARAAAAGRQQRAPWSVRPSTAQLARMRTLACASSCSADRSASRRRSAESLLAGALDGALLCRPCSAEQQAQPPLCVCKAAWLSTSSADPPSADVKTAGCAPRADAALPTLRANCACDSKLASPAGRRRAVNDRLAILFTCGQCRANPAAGIVVFICASCAEVDHQRALANLRIFC